MVQPHIRPIKIERWFVLSIGSSLSPWLGVVFHPLSTLVESDGARKASSATFFQRVETYLNPDGLKNLVPAHFSNSQKFYLNLMD